MERLLSYLPDNLDYAALLMLRVSALIFSSPLFGRQAIPQRIKVGFCLALTALFLFSQPLEGTVAVRNLPSFIVLCVSELLLGMALGYITTTFFALTFTAGQLVDNQMGFGMVNVYDPQSGSQIPVTGNVFNFAMLLCFYATGAHHTLFKMLHYSIEAMPIGQVAFTPDLGLVAVSAFAGAFLLGVQVAMPFVASGLLAEAAMGVIIRSVPQMNMFVVGIPLKVVIGLIMLYLMIGVFVQFTPHLFESMYDSINMAFTALKGGA